MNLAIRGIEANLGDSWGDSFGKDKVTMDFAFFAIAFNIKKMAAMMAKPA